MSSEIPGDRPPDSTQPRPPDGAGYGAAPTARPRRNGMGTAALVIGVVALVLVVLILLPRSAPSSAWWLWCWASWGWCGPTGGRPTTVARPWLAW